MKKWIKLISISFAFLLLDFFIKRYVFFNIPKISWLYPVYPYGGIKVFKDVFGVSFSINFVQNPGAAWGAFSSYTTYLFYLRVIIIIALIGYLIFSKIVFKKAMALCLIITGAIGNILDYIIYGYVVDMFYFTFGSYSYPVFNLADSLITVGIVWLFVISILERKKGDIK